VIDTVTIDGARLWDSLMALGEVGAYDDEPTGLRGVRRLALTDADAAGRRMAVDWMREAGLEVRVDRIGNVFARRAGADAGAAPVMFGSHVDSVATAGRFDGVLGVLGAIEVVRTLDDRGILTERPLDVVFFTEEEGARFDTDMLGSAVAAGRIPLDAALALTDPGGATVGDELARIGFAGEEPERLAAPHAYVELHVEQGPILAAEGHDLGVVTGVQGISWFRVAVTGRAAHAGATPTALRADAGLVAARIVTHLRDMVDSGSYGELRATVGRIELEPGLTNVVPAVATLTVDLRNPDDGSMAAAEAELRRRLDELAGEPGIGITCEQTARTAHVPFDESVQDVIAAAADSLGLRHRRILAGAGHDAQEMAAICPAAMIFVPGQYDGISHSPREYSTPEACADGATVLARTVLRLAGVADGG
jgi:N-carbamoyl-L-amino-acid hydrolase